MNNPKPFLNPGNACTFPNEDHPKGYGPLPPSPTVTHCIFISHG